ncbi:MAG: DUF1080 domain-containing protein [bacterium]|nr:DUF1080 domain-containing protein [bacterium]
MSGTSRLRRRPARLAALALCTLAACESGPRWQPLLGDSKLAPFAVTEFGGEGPVTVAGDTVQLEIGSPLTGIHWQSEAPPPGADGADYELAFEATRETGTDFFCGLTFPIRGQHLTLILGGWGGALCGLSSLDGQDAARNATRTLRHFENGRPYRIRLSVQGAMVRVVIDDEPLLAVDTAPFELSLRPEVELSRPLGFATFATTARIADLRWRRLTTD